MSGRVASAGRASISVLLIFGFLSLSRAVFAETSGRGIVIGSKPFTESRLLAEIMAQLIEAHTDIVVDRRPNLGGTKLTFAALQAAEIDMYPEYTGTGWSVLLGRSDRVHGPLEGFFVVQEVFRERYGLEWLMPFGFSNSYALAMMEDRAEELGIRQLSDLKAHDRHLVAGMSHEFIKRDDGYRGLAETYGFRIGDLRGMDHGLAYEALRSGRVDIVDTWTTDAKLFRYRMRLLIDDRSFFPPYDAAPLVRADTLERLPELRPLLRRLAFRFDNAKMAKLNFRVEDEGGAFAEVARDFLREEGLVGALASTPSGRNEHFSKREPVGRPRSLWAYWWAQRKAILKLTGQHMFLTLIAVGLAILISVPLGLFITRQPVLASPVLTATGVIQTVPSLALLVFMIPIPFLGIGPRAAIAALFVYALLPIVRNTYTGVKEVDPNLIEAAEGMGLTDLQILFRVELPLAVRTIMAGVRTSTVISIGIATIAAFIGAGGLGDPIVTGLQLDDNAMILSGAVPAALLAVSVDFALGRVEHWLTPRGLG